jgi:hypothetical protein
VNTLKGSSAGLRPSNMSGSSVMRALAAGFAGACAITILHEILKRTAAHPPRLDILGMRAIAKGMRMAEQPVPQRLHDTALAGDLIANTAYYSLVAAAGSQRALLTGSLLGAGAGLGAILLPKPMGLGVGPSDRTAATQAMAVSLYLAGGVLAGAAYQKMRE